MLSDGEMSYGLPLLNDKLRSNKVVVEHQPDSHLTVDMSTLLHPPHGKKCLAYLFLDAMVLTCSSQDAGCMDYFPYLHEGSKFATF